MAVTPTKGPHPIEEYRSKAAQSVEQFRIQKQRDDEAAAYEQRVEFQRQAMERRYQDAKRQADLKAKLTSHGMQAKAKMQALAQQAQQDQGGEQPSMDIGQVPLNSTNPEAGTAAGGFAKMDGTQMGGQPGPPVSNFGQPGGPQPGSPQAQQAQAGPMGNVPPYIMEAIQRQSAKPVQLLGNTYQSPYTETTTRIRPNALTAGDAMQAQLMDQRNRQAAQQAALAQQFDLRHQLATEAQARATASETASYHQGTLEARNREVDARIETNKQKQEFNIVQKRDTMLAPYAAQFADPNKSDEQVAAELSKISQNMNPDTQARLGVLVQSARTVMKGDLNKQQWVANIKAANDTYEVARTTADTIQSIRDSNIEEFAGLAASWKSWGLNIASQVPGSEIIAKVRAALGGVSEDEAKQWIHDRGVFTTNIAALTAQKIRALFPTGRAITTEARLLEGLITSGTSNPADIRGKVDELARLASYEIVRSKLWVNDPTKIGKPLRSVTIRDVEQTLTDEAKAMRAQGNMTDAAISKAIEVKYDLPKGILPVMVKKFGQEIPE